MGLFVLSLRVHFTLGSRARCYIHIQTFHILFVSFQSCYYSKGQNHSNVFTKSNEMRISLELVQAIASRFFLLKTPHDWLPTSEIHLCHLVWFMHNKLYNSTHLNSFVPACVGDQTAAKMRKIVTHFHLVHVPTDIVVRKGPLNMPGLFYIPQFLLSLRY